MNELLRPWISAPFLASSGHASCDVASSTPRIRVPAVLRLHAHLHGLVTTIHEKSGLGIERNKIVGDARDRASFGGVWFCDYQNSLALRQTEVKLVKDVPNKLSAESVQP